MIKHTNFKNIYQIISLNMLNHVTRVWVITTILCLFLIVLYRNIITCTVSYSFKISGLAKNLDTKRELNIKNLVIMVYEDIYYESTPSTHDHLCLLCIINNMQEVLNTNDNDHR